VNRWLKLGFSAVCVASLSALAWPIGARLLSRKRLRFTYLSTPLSQDAYDELANRPGWSKSTLTVASNVKLRGLVRRPSQPQAPWVLFYPGNDATQLRTGQDFLTALSKNFDWGLALFAYRGYDSSDGESKYQSLALDAPSIFTEFCAQEHISESRVHLAGFSIGGHFATLASRSANAHGRSAKSLTLLASVSDIAMLPNSRLAFVLVGDVYETLPILDGIARPVLVLQGSADEALDGPFQGRAIAQKLSDRARYQEFEGVGHQSLLLHEPAQSAMRSFILEHSR